MSARVEAAEQILGIDGLSGKASSNILAGMWQKLAAICGANICCVVRGSKEDVSRGMPETGELTHQLVSEVVQIARAKRVDLADEAIDACLGMFNALLPHFKPSMLVGLERGDRIELDALNGAVVRYGRELGIPTPANGFVYACLKPYAEGVERG